ncbi:restriction endonuclease subunit S [Winogradskyella sp.]|nr:restriction endonuclease subunit S [Winogradskyella sp.]MDB4752601.1 restriction endonuclease subunit S [Winogradskyella sp.]
MERYDSYKDSGVEWIGEIPSHWVNSKFKYLTKKEVQYGVNSSSDNYCDEGIRFIRTTDIDDFGKLKIGGVFIEEDGIDKSQITEEFDFLISRSGTLGRTYLHQSNERMTYGGYLVRFNFGHPSLSKFIQFYCHSTSFWDWISLNTIVSTIGNVNGQKYNNMEVPLPPLSEQQQIVSFLDTKTSLIDSLIEKTQRKIELLKEKRTALINEVVTKGLNPNVEMKDSGVEWIGEIPSSWSKTKISRFCEVKDGTHDTPKYIDISEESIPLVTSNSFVNGEIDFSKSKRISTQDYIEINKRSDVKFNDVIMSMIGSNIGNRVLVQTEKPFSIKNVCLFKTSNSQKLNSKYLIYLIDSKYLKYQVDFNQKGGGQPFLSLDELRSLLFPFPPISEQQQIVSYLDEQTQLIDKTISIEEKRIELLKEYRQSLISEVVTGKINIQN